MSTAFLCPHGFPAKPREIGGTADVQGPSHCPECAASRYPDLQKTQAFHSPLFYDNRPTPPTRTSRGIEPQNHFPQLRDYEILCELGRGGMGVVYKARHRTLNRLVAIKMILAGDCASDEDQSRFMIEAEAVARLQHPNIVQLYEIGEYQGRPFFALEFVSGQSLARLIINRAVPPLRAAAILESVAQAIHHAHQQGIVHRDLKPGNIIIAEPKSGSPILDSNNSNYANQPPPQPLCNDDYFRSGIPKVTDFGLAKQLFDQQNITVSGMALGTPNYMAPENALGNAKQVGPASDIFSLGTILYEMLAGQQPFAGDSPVQIMMKVVHEEPESICRLQPHVPRDLVTICERCLEKEPSRRYPSAEALAEDLRRFREGESIHAQRVGRLEHVLKWARRRPAPAALIALFILIGLVGVPGFAALWLRADRALEKESVARLEAIRLSTEEHKARETAEWQVYFSRIALARNEHQQNRIGDSNEQLDRCDPSKRGWEWELLKALNHADVMTVEYDHYSDVMHLAFSPDGTMLLGSLANKYQKEDPGRTTIWNFPTGKEFLTSTGSRSIHRSIAWLPDGKTAYFSTDEGRIFRWDLQTQSTTLFKQLHATGATFLALSPDGKKMMTTVIDDRRFQLWSIPDGRQLFESPIRTRMTEPSYSHDGKYFAYSTPEGELLVHNSVTGALVQHFENGGRRPMFHPRENRLVAVQGPANVWNLETGKIERTYGGDDGSVMAAAYSPDGRSIATAGADGTVRLWDTRSGLVTMTFRGHRGRVGCLCFHPSGRFLASGGEQPADVKVWDLTRDPEFDNLLPDSSEIQPVAICFSAETDRMLVATKNSGSRLWDRSITTGANRAVYPIEVTGRWLTPAIVAAFTVEGNKLATIGSSEKCVHIYDTATGQRERTIELPDTSIGQLFQVRWSRNGERIIANARCIPGKSSPSNRPGREIYVWDVATGALRAGYRTDFLVGRRLHGAAVLSPDGCLMAYDESIVEIGKEASYGAPQSIRIREVETGNLVQEISLDPDLIMNNMEFSPDGKNLAVLDRDDNFQLWNIEDGKARFPKPLPSPAYTLVFRPDGKQLAAANREQIRVWDLASGMEAIELRTSRPRQWDSGFNPQLAWAADGKRLAVTNQTHEIHVWTAEDLASADGNAKQYEGAFSRSSSWHLRSASEALHSRNPLAVRFHLDRLQGAVMDDRESTRKRAILDAELGNWTGAYRNWELSPTRLRVELSLELLQTSILAHHANEPEKGRRLTQLIPIGFPQLPIEDRNRLARLRALSPIPRKDAEVWIRDADLAMPNDPQQDFWFRHTHGWTLYQAGRYREAATALAEVTRKFPNHPQAVCNTIALAVAQQACGQPLEAQQSWQQAVQQMAALRAVTAKRDLGKVPEGWAWWDWATAELLEREANERFANKPR